MAKISETEIVDIESLVETARGMCEEDKLERSEAAQDVADSMSLEDIRCLLDEIPSLLTYEPYEFGSYLEDVNAGSARLTAENVLRRNIVDLIVEKLAEDDIP